MITNSLLHQITYGREGKNWGYSMGLPKLEEIIDGVTQSTYTLIFSPTGTGKSSIALYSYIYKPLMEHLEDDDFKVTYFSLEMSAEMLYAKLLSMYIFEKYHIELSTKELLSRKKDYTLSDEHYEIVKQCLPWLHRVEEIVTVYDKSLSAEGLYSILMKELEKSGTFTETEGRKIYTPNNEKLIHLVVIDHLSLARRTNGRTLKEEMDLISSYLVTLRNRCKISPLVIMQANRNSTAMDRRKEGLNNLRIDDVSKFKLLKNVCYEDVKNLGPLGLAIWYMDDGYKNKPYGGCTLCTNCFNTNSLEILKEVLQNNFNIYATSNQSSGVLYIPSSEFPKFKKIVEPYIVPCLNYKVSS